MKYTKLREKLEAHFVAQGWDPCYLMFFHDTYEQYIKELKLIVDQEKLSLHRTYMSFFDENGDFDTAKAQKEYEQIYAYSKKLTNFFSTSNISPNKLERFISEQSISQPGMGFQWGLNYEAQASKTARNLATYIGGCFTLEQAISIQEFLIENDPNYSLISQDARFDYCLNYLKKQEPELNKKEFISFIETYEEIMLMQLKTEMMKDRCLKGAPEIFSHENVEVSQEKKISEEGPREESHIRFTQYISKQEFNAILENNFKGIIGLDEVKDELRKYMAKSMFIPQNRPYNLLLTGNPGTGKTTAAKLIGKVLYASGAIKKDKFAVMTAADLQGQYVGQTIPKIQSLFNKNKGGVIFLDEIYSLATDTAFTKDAVNELLLQLESESNAGTIIIAAGYDNRIEEFFNANPGLKSRFNSKIHLKDYTEEQLMQIANEQLKEAQFDIEESASAKLSEHFSEEKKKKNFGNARYVRKAVDGVILNTVMRIWDEADPSPIIIEEDVTSYIETYKANNNTERKIIGFN